MVKLSKRNRAPAMAYTHRSPTSSTSTLVNEQTAAEMRRQQRKAYRVRFKLPARFWKRTRAILSISAKSNAMGVQRTSTPAPGLMTARMAETVTRSLSPRNSADSESRDSVYLTPARATSSRTIPSSSAADLQAGAKSAGPIIHVSTTVVQGSPTSIRPVVDLEEADLRGQLQQAKATIAMLQRKVSSEEMLITSMRKQIKSLELTMQATNERYLESLAENRSLRRKSIPAPAPEMPETPKKSRRSSFTEAVRSRAQSLPPVARSAKSSKQLSKETPHVRTMSRHVKSNSESAISRLQRDDYGVKPGTRTRPQTSSASTTDLPNPWDPNAQQTLTDSINELLRPQHANTSEAWSDAVEFPGFSDHSPTSTSSTVSCSPVRTPRDEKSFDVAAFNIRKLSMSSSGSSGLGIALPTSTLPKDAPTVSAKDAFPPSFHIHSASPMEPLIRAVSPAASSIYSFRPELPSKPSRADLMLAPSTSPRPYVPLRSARRLPKSPRAMSFSPEPAEMVA